MSSSVSAEGERGMTSAFAAMLFNRLPHPKLFASTLWKGELYRGRRALDTKRRGLFRNGHTWIGKTLSLFDPGAGLAAVRGD